MNDRHLGKRQGLDVADDIGSVIGVTRTHRKHMVLGWRTQRGRAAGQAHRGDTQLLNLRQGSAYCGHTK